MLLSCLEVPAGREGPARAGDDDGADGAVPAGDVGDDLGEAVAHLGGLRVQDGRPVQRDLHHLPDLLRQHGRRVATGAAVTPAGTQCGAGSAELDMYN